MCANKKYVKINLDGKEKYGLLDSEGKKVCILNGKNLDEFVKTDTYVDYDKNNIIFPLNPQKIICSGLNYKDTVLREGDKMPIKPLLFLKPASAIIGDGDYIVKPEGTTKLSIEAELAVVIGKKGKNIKREDADEYIWGYMASNDVTAQDFQKEDVQWTRAKSYDSFLPMSNVIVSGLDPENINVKSYLNGEIVQNGNTKDMIFGIRELIEYISHVMTLEVGDIILTGTPAGYGINVDVDDEIIIEIDEVGKIKNEVKAEK